MCVQTGWAQPVGSGAQTVTATATLSVLAGPVQHVPAGSNQSKTATDGMTLTAGDRIQTGPKATALITFLDGSTATIQPESEIVIKKAEAAGSKTSTISIQINFGTVWARVIRAADPNSSFSLESNAAAATVHDGLIGGRQNADGSFVCWSMSGDPMTVQDLLVDRPPLTLQPGQEAMVQHGRAPAPQPHAVSRSWLQITAPAEVLPLVLLPDKTRVVGYVAPGIEVNQVLGSVTGVKAGGTHIIEVPAGASGPFRLVLEGRREGSFAVKIVGLLRESQSKESEAYHQELPGTIKKGERVVTEITQQLDSATSRDPKTAKIQSGRATPWQPLSGSLPGKIVLSSKELAAAGE